MAALTASDAWAKVTTPLPTEVTLNLGAPQTQGSSLLLRANVPSTVTLTGPADLVFHSLTLTLTSKPLWRNLAESRWGTTRSTLASSSSTYEWLLTAPARIHGMGVRKAANDPASAVRYRSGAGFVTLKETLALSAESSKHIGYEGQIIQTDAAQVTNLAEGDELLLLSPSLPSRIGVALGEDSPLQVFPSEMTEGSTVTSRDLAAALTAAWQRSGDGSTATVKLRLTAVTDGLVSLSLAGAWGRSYVSQPLELAVNPFAPSTAGFAWQGPETAQATLWVGGKLEPGRRFGLAGGPATFGVRVTEHLEVAHAFRLAEGEAPGPARHLTALWLMLQAIPREESRVQLRLTGAQGDPAVPADEPMTTLDATLPADCSAYLATAGGYWFRAAFPRPFALDGATAGRPLFVVAAGQGAGLLLAHRSEAPLPGSRGRVPGVAGVAGHALVRNWSRTGSWEEQTFNQQSSLWLMDVEVQPLAIEWPQVAAVSVQGSDLHALPFTGSGATALQIGPFPVSKGGADLFQVQALSLAAGRLTARVGLYRQIMPPVS